MSERTEINRFFSLKWKAMLLTSIVLLAMTGSFALFDHFELRKQFAERREELQDQYVRQVQELLDQANHRLVQLGTTVASLPTIQNLARQEKKKGLTEVFGHLSATLILNLGVEHIALVSTDGEILASHITDDDAEGQGMLAERVDQVLKNESPQQFIHCTDTCLQYAIAPVLGSDGVIGALILGASLADVITDFHRVSGTDVGLVVEQPDVSRYKGSITGRWFPRWHANIVALTNAQRNLPLLNRIADRGVVLNDLLRPLRAVADDREYEVRIFPLTGFGERQRAFLTVIADISEAMARIRNATHRSISLGIAGLLIAEIFLLGILWAPMSRLRRATENLPRLAVGAFATVRAAITGNRRKSYLRDEVDVLNETAIALSHQLETLSYEVAQRTRDLSERMKEITHERNFVAHILDTAQAVILTQDRHNRILMVNRYGESLTGYRRAELIGLPFTDLLAKGIGGSDAGERLAELVSGKRWHLEEERDLCCKDGTVVNVFWQHSRLGEDVGNETAVLSVGMDITARKKAELRLTWLANHDPLTGLFNRRRFEEELELAIASATRYRHSGALLFFDLDQFKYVNDTSGHAAGDQLLRTLSQSLPTVLREIDVIGRLGGDEFGVILLRATVDKAIRVAKKILTHVQETEFSIDGRTYRISASLGIALFPDHGSEVQDLLARADLAMYQVKEAGRGGWHMLSNDDSSHRLMQEYVTWKRQIENALTKDRFLLYIQPIVAIPHCSTSHYEVLLRMRGEDGSVIGPFHFIEVAERSGLIRQIDRMVMAKSIHDLADLRDRGRKVTLTLNLSAYAFRDNEFLTHLGELLWQTRLDPQQLIFEVTETSALADLDAARRLMEAIRDIGCQFALDDFGTGFSSFSYLKELPFDFIKIDGSFIRNLADRHDDQVLVKAMAEIARAYRKKTIAEQVEDQRTLDLLAEYGIDYAQGYFTGVPQPITDLFETIGAKPP
jgi:diguanylate cyclase (GGDEF)-like protein/PAS domain S-box-containing protein